MTLDQFRLLEDKEKEHAIWDGVFTAVRMEGDLRVPLYKFEDFYVEVYYDANQNKIIRFNAFEGDPIMYKKVDFE